MATAVYLVARKSRAKRKRKKWVLRWQDATGKWQQESCRTADKRAAQSLRQQKFDELNGLAALVEAPAMTWDEFAKADLDILKARQRASATVEIAERALASFKSVCDPATPFDVTRAMAEQFVVTRADRDRQSAATVNKELRTLKAVFSRAVRRELMQQNPFGRVEKLREPEKVKRILSDAELVKLVAELKKRDAPTYAAVLVALATAARIGELANLKWESIDLESGDLNIVNNGDWRTKSTRNRYEWLPEFVREALRPLKASSWQGYVFADRLPAKWYFRADDVFGRAVKAAKIAHCSFHDLRETALTSMAEGGAGVWVLQSIAGHSTPNVTAKHYVGVGRAAVRSVISQHGERLRIAVGA